MSYSGRLLVPPGMSRNERSPGQSMRENPLWQDVRGWLLGIPPLRARGSAGDQDSRGAAVGMTAWIDFLKGMGSITRETIWPSIFGNDGNIGNFFPGSIPEDTGDSYLCENGQTP